MDKAHPLSFPMVVLSLDVKKDPFRPCENGEELLDLKVPYLSVIGALMYIANYTRPDIAFSVNLLARYSSTQPKNIGMVSSIYCVISKEQLMWVYFIQRNQSNNCLDMLM